jgi:hypothetical protein
MLEFGFENLRWSDVCARVTQGIVNIEGVLGFIKARVSAEEKFGKALKDVADSSSGGMFGLGGRADVNAECNTLFAALEASKQAAAKVHCIHEWVPIV